MAAYIKFDGVKGESKDKGHKEWCDLFSVSQSVHRAGGGATGAQRRRGNAQVEDIRCTKLLDGSSNTIAEAVLLGKVYPKVEIELTADTVGSGRETYFRYELKNVMVTSYSVSGGANDKPSEDFSLNFEEIKCTYTPVDETGKKGSKVEYGWKCEEGEKA